MTDFDPDAPEPRSPLRSEEKVRHVTDDELGFATETVSDTDIEDFARKSGFGEERVDRWIRALQRKGQAIFYGPPGTGKTYSAERVAAMLTGNDDRVETLQFHPGYSYEEFIQGMRPTYDEAKDSLTYPVEDGRFVEFCDRARGEDGYYALVLDELNRAEVSAVFGELMHLLEYREKEMTLPQREEPFSVPDNLFVIGTMNTADRSIALVDFALRRRFAMIQIEPSYDVLRNFHADTGHDVDGLVNVLKEINETIGDEDFYVGITFFLEERLDEHIADIWEMEIEPYLEEYFFDQRDVVEDYRWDAVEGRVQP